MTTNQRKLTPLFFALAVLAASAWFLISDKKPKYDEYDRLMW